MSRLCEGRVAIVTGAGRGLGREHALLLAAHGAKVMVNDIGAGIDGSGRDNDTPAELAALVAFCRGLLCHVNLIPMNAVEGRRTPVRPMTGSRASGTALMDAGTEASVRVERGGDIDAACGQLRQRCER